MYLGQQAIREQLINTVTEMLDCKEASAETKEAAKVYLETKDDTVENAKATEKLIKCCEGEKTCPHSKEILAKKDYLSKKSVWIFGGDG